MDIELGIGDKVKGIVHRGTDKDKALNLLEDLRSNKECGILIMIKGIDLNVLILDIAFISTPIYNTLGTEYIIELEGVLV